MKKVFSFAAMLAIAASCTVSEIDSIKGTTAPEITASYESNGTKTAITTDNEGVGTIWWKPADEINVFYGTTSTHYTSKNTENATTVAFGTTDVIGSTESASENIWGLYPYDRNAVCDGESVTTTIPATQKAVAGTFDDDIFTSLAHSTSTTMTFYNVLGGIKFSLSRDDIQSITFKGNNDENIAGKVSLSMDANGKPVAEITEGEKTITLTPKEGTTFASNTNYYIVLLPTVLSNGFTMTFETETALGTFEYTAKSIEIKRSVFSKKENIDSYAEFSDKQDSDPEYVDLGLSVMWATCNLGASSPEQSGDFYAWGETEPKTEYRWTNYKYCNGTSSSMTKYSTVSNYGDNGFVDGKIMLDAEDDAATAIKGIGWRMPTLSEVDELYDNTTFTYTTVNGIKGYKFQSKISGYTDNWIFIPAAGFFNGTSIITEANSHDPKYYADCWAKNIYPGQSNLAYLIDLEYNGYYGYPNISWSAHDSRYVGRSIRPVYDAENAGVAGISLDKHSITTVVSVSEKLKATLSRNDESNRTDYIEWKSSNPSVASVDYSGVVTAKAVGKTTITARSPFGGFTDECIVTVTAATKGYVDLGLSVKWANCNLGANAPGEVGLFYQWGDTQGYGSNTSDGKIFNWADYSNNIAYKWCNGTYDTLTKYVPSSAANSYGYNKFYDNKTTLELTDDAAHVALGSNSRIPTSEEWAELRNTDNCTWTPCGKGYKVQSKITGYTDNWIFIPATGQRSGSSIESTGYGYYWSSNLYTPNYAASDRAIIQYFSPGSGSNKEYNTSRSFGCNIRPVSD